MKFFAAIGALMLLALAAPYLNPYATLAVMVALGIFAGIQGLRNLKG